VLVDGAGGVVSRGRNRVLERPGSGRVAGTLLAHAEVDAFAALDLRTAEGLTLFTTVEPCLMCAATAIAVRTTGVRYAAADPVFEGLDEALSTHPYMEGRMPDKQQLGEPVLSAFAAALPLANRVWSRPGVAPRAEWVSAHRAVWSAAERLIDSGTLANLKDTDATVEDAIDAVVPILTEAGAV
jgi:tRNA(Arg) A34 adenosine deaminase TadA